MGEQGLSELVRAVSGPRGDPSSPKPHTGTKVASKEATQATERLRKDLGPRQMVP